MENTPLISVVITTFNRPELLIESVQSVLDQTYQHFEIIIVDDCSSPENYTKTKDLTKLDERIRVFQTPHNMGNNLAKNLGIRQANGEFVAILDDDDLALPERLEKQLAVFEKNPEIGVVAAQIRYIQSHGISSYTYPPTVALSNYPKSGDAVFSDLFLGYYNFANTVLLIRTDIIRANGYPDLRESGGDMVMMMKLAASGIPYAALKEPLVLVRKNSQHMQMTRELEAVQKGRLNKLQLTLDWLGENGITKFKHLTSQAYKNNQTWAMFELANHQGLSGLPLLLKAILTNPLYAIRKFIYLAPQAIQKRIDRS